MNKTVFWMRTAFLALCLFASAYAAAASVQATEWSRFSALYNQSKTASEAVVRLEKMEALRASAQTSLTRLLEKQPQNLDLQLRYGELVVQRGRDLEQFSFEMALLGQDKESKDLKARSLRYLREGLAWNERVLARGRTHALAPLIHLSLARTHYSLGKKDQALQHSDLGLAAVNSSRAPDLQSVQLQLWLLKGDSAFDLSRAPLAQQAYSKARSLAGQGSMELTYIIYKLAWVHYNLKDPVTALGHLDELFVLGSDRLALRQEAVRDFSLFLADAPRIEFERRGGFSGIYSSLVRAGDETLASVSMERLGQVLAKNGRRSEAVAAFDFLIQERARDPKGVTWALTIIEWSQSLADKKALTEKYFWLLKEFGRGSPWFQAQSGQVEVQRLALDSIEKALRVYAVGLHEEAGKEQRLDLRDQKEKVVASLYDSHIEHFNRDLEATQAEAARIHYYRAEIHRRLKEAPRAGERYDSYLQLISLVPEAKRPKLDQKLRESALWESTSVWAEAIEKDPQWVPQMLVASDRFVKELPKHRMAAQVELDAARVEAKLGQLPLALVRLRRIVDVYPKTSQAGEAVHAQLDLLNKSSDWINLAQSARRYFDKASEWVQPAELERQKQRLVTILSQTEARACEALRSDGQRKIEAALCFEAFSRNYPKDTQAPNALLIAADLFDELKDPAASLAALDRLVKSYPQSKESLGAFSKLAAAYEKNFNFEQAIGVYEKLRTRDLESKERGRILERLALLYWNLDRQAELQKLLSDSKTSDSIRRDFESRRLEALVDKWTRQGEAAGFEEAFWTQPETQTAMQEIGKHLSSGALNLSQELRVRRLRGLQHRSAKRLDRADEEWMAGLKSFWRANTKSSEHWHHAAKLRLEQAVVWELSFRNTDVMKNPSRKAELFAKLEKWYGEVIQMKAPAVALEALWASARLNLQFAQDLRGAPIPDELMVAGQENAKAEYQDLIFEKTEPLRKKSLKLIESLAGKAQEWKIVSPTVLSALHVVRQMKDGNAFPNELGLKSDSALLRFPWAELPRWMDLSSESTSWPQWKWSVDELRSSLQRGSRSEQRKAAFVLLAREGSLRDARVKSWAETFNDKAGVQLRIQALIQDQNLSLAGLFLDQYRSFHGTDAFYRHWAGQWDWSRGQYLEAYAQWSSVGSDATFAELYWSLGWEAMFQALNEQKPLEKRFHDSLQKLAQAGWKSQYLAKLCIETQLQCEGNVWAGWIERFGKELEPEHVHQNADGRDVWTMRREAMKSAVERYVDSAANIESLAPLRVALSHLWDLRDKSFDKKSDRETLTLYNSLKKRVDDRQDALDQIQKSKAVTVGAVQ
jgi:hypothetical protein